MKLNFSHDVDMYEYKVQTYLAAGYNNSYQLFVIGANASHGLV